MATDTSIVNIALAAVAGDRITALDDGSENANRASDIYADLRDDMLRGHPWNFATLRVKLARSASTPIFGFDYAYTLPSDWLRTLSVHDDDEGLSIPIYRDETLGTERSIYSDSTDIYLRYVAQITDANKMPPDFRRALSMALARDLAVPLANSNTLRDAMDKAAKLALAKAKGSDAQDSPPERFPESSWVTVRQGWGGSPFDPRNR